MQTYFIDVLKNKYADFNGRARRQEFWMFYLIIAIIGVVLGSLVFAFGDSSLAMVFSGIYGLFFLAILVPFLALYVRRLHDIGKSGGWIFVVFIPLVGVIWLLVLLVTDSQPNANEYGECPK